MSAVATEDLRLAGFALAHALASVDGGDTLCTMAILRSEEGVELVRYPDDSIAASITRARQDIRDRLRPAETAVVVFDGYATVDDVRSGALIVDIVDPTGEPLVRMVQRYRPGHYRPLALLRMIGIPAPGAVKMIGTPSTLAADDESLVPAVLAGFGGHPAGRRLLKRLQS